MSKFEHLGKRFIPKNVGYALVVSGLADVYVTRLKRSGRMVGYQVVPVMKDGQALLDVNTITFMLNPAYTMNGSLDGLTGTSATSNRFFRHVPALRAQMGSLYPASYYRLQEAYDIKEQIEQFDKDREAYFTNFSSRGVLITDAEIGANEDNYDVLVGPESQGDVEDEGEQEGQDIQSRISNYESQVHATESFATWQKKMENLLIRAGKRNIVNTYVWDADGGWHSEVQQFANTVEHTIGGSFNLEAALGFEGDFSIMKASFSLKAQATVHMTQTMTKTESRSKGFSLEVDLSGVESTGVTDYNDYPLLPGEKVDRYRFMSFYLEGNTQHFHDFFDYVVDPEWLQSNDEEARALRQVMNGTPNKAWRVLHRVTYVERPALMGFGRDVRQLPTGEEDEVVQPQQLLARLHQLEQDSRELANNIAQFLRSLAPRVTKNLQVLYTFQEGSGETITDVSSVGDSLDMIVHDGADIWCRANRLTIQKSTLVATTDPATKIIETCQATNEIAIETWVKPAKVTQEGPARIVTLSADTGHRNFTLGQVQNQYNVRLRTTKTGKNGTERTVSSPAGSLTTDLTHVVYTRDARGQAKVYLDGTEVASEVIAGNLSNWNGDYQLALANELTGDRTWLGELHLVAIYSRALTQDEVKQNFKAGTTRG